MELRKKNNNAIDLAKFIGAVCIVFLHAYRLSPGTSLLGSLIDGTVCVIALPFFFLTSGYFLFKKIVLTPEKKKKIFGDFIRRLILLYVIWSAIYFPFVVSKWDKTKLLPELASYMWRFFMVGSFETIWYLLALIIGTLLVYTLSFRLSYKQIFCCSIPFYLFGVFGANYYGFVVKYAPGVIAKGYLTYFDIFHTVKNGVMLGFIFIALGALISQSETVRKEQENPLQNHRINLWLMVISFMLSSCEFIIIRILKFETRGYDLRLMLIPLTFFLFLWVKDIHLKSHTGYLKLRKYSILIFLSQRLFLTLYPKLLPRIGLGIVIEKYYLYFFVILLSATTFSKIVIRLSETKSGKFLKYCF